jgi:hypothetical protein
LTLALVLAFALITVFGSQAHACHGSVHSVAHDIAAHKTADNVLGEAHDTASTPGSDQVPHKGTPPCCADLQCQGGIAIVSTGFMADTCASSAEKFSISDQTHEGWHLACLDRPPMVAVQF